MKSNTQKGLNIGAKLLLYSGMAFYLLCLFLLLFNKKEVGTYQSVNLVPFREIGAFLFPQNSVRRAFALGNLLGNIVLFVPLGLYISLLNPRGKILVNTLLVTAASVAAEVMQYVFMVGASDIDDVILNTLGGLAGALAFRLLSRLFGQNVKRAVALLALLGALLVFAVLLYMNR